MIRYLILILLLTGCGGSSIVTDSEANFTEAWFKNNYNLPQGWVDSVDVRYATHEEVDKMCRTPIRNAFTGCTAHDASEVLIVKTDCCECYDILHELGHVASYKIFGHIDRDHTVMQSWYSKTFSEVCGE